MPKFCTRSEEESKACEALEIETGPVTHAEIRTAIQQTQNRKAGDVNGVTTELMKADLETTVAVLNELLLKIWESERVPNDWICLSKKETLSLDRSRQGLGEKGGQSSRYSF